MPTPSRFTQARNSRGEVQRVPRAWLEDGSPFAGQFTQTPSARQVEERSSDPDETWTVQQLRAHAEQVGLDLAGRTTKADIVSAFHDRASGSTTTTTDPQEG